MVKLESKEKKIIEVDTAAARMSLTIKNVMDDLGIDEEDQESVVPLPALHARTLVQVMEWCKFQKDISNKSQDEINEFDLKYDNIDKFSLFWMVTAANYLNIPDLTKFASEKIADTIKTMDTESMRRYFCILENEYY